jgi:hypothetical protein
VSRQLRSGGLLAPRTAPFGQKPTLCREAKACVMPMHGRKGKLLITKITVQNSRTMIIIPHFLKNNCPRRKKKEEHERRN